MTTPKSLDQVRQAYLDFFKGKGHLVVPSSSLIPAGDPTLLLTSAGMVPFKPYFTGEQRPPSPRLASVQKCFRASDIDSVGDTKHLTFFEMLGNFSIGDYFKREAIAWAWEFVTGVLRIPPERLWVTYFKDNGQEDLEAKGFWLEATKGALPESRIVALDARYNWWGPAGEEGPCGPCSEIHYSFDPANTTVEDLTGDSPRAVEIWNLVFTQFYHHRDGRRTPLPAPNIDTGMGLERTAAVVQGVQSVYQSDAFRYLVEAAARLAGKTYGASEEADFALRVVAEHARSVTFLMADGVAPSNEGRGYVLRRVLRRAVRYGRKAGIKGPFLRELAAVVTERMGRQYPELEREREFVASVIQGEEERFAEVYERGIQMFESFAENRAEKQAIIKNIGAMQPDLLTGRGNVQTKAQRFNADIAQYRGWPGGEIVDLLQHTIEIEANRAGATETSLQEVRNRFVQSNLATEITGYEAFILHDTYGFPVDVTADVAREHGMTVDMAGFQREMEAQRERARAAAKFGLGDKVSPETYKKLAVLPGKVSSGRTRFTGYESLREQTVVIGLLAGGAPAERASKGQRVEVVLRETPFYAESGGQVGDTGELRGPLGLVRVTDTQSPIAGLIVHAGEVAEGEIAAGEPVEAMVDAARRADVVRNHTGTHLLHAALRRVLGAHVRQAGSLVAPDRLRFDFSHPGAIGAADLQAIERTINDAIMANLPVTHKTMAYKDAIAQGALAFFGERYGDTVRTCRIGDGESFSFELCGGTHARATGEIGLLHIEGEGSIAAGTRRVEAVTGRGTGGLLSQRHVLLESLSKQLKAAPAEMASRVAALLEELDRERKRAAALERDLARRQAEALPSQARVIDGVTVLTAQVSASSPEALREMGEWLRGKVGSGVIVLGAVVNGKAAFVAFVTPDLTAKGYHAGNILREVAKAAGGGGGGRPEMAQAGGKDASKVGEALALVPGLVKKR